MIEVCPHAKRRAAKTLVLALFLTLIFISIFAIGLAPVSAEDTNEPPHLQFIPLVVQPGTPAVVNSDAIELVNEMRTEADIPPVNESDPLNDNCYEHARYMAENNVLAHDQNPNLPYASESGQSCAQNANAWLGRSNDFDNWTPDDSVEVWMGSVGHRLWLLYPTTKSVGYGFFRTDEENRAAAALDVLSSAQFDADEAYEGWPIQYPVGEVMVSSTRYPITLNWRYFGPKPVLGKVQLQTADGQALAFDANTNLPAGHKGIQIIPKADLPPNSLIRVTVNGSYDGVPFSSSWDFRTGD